MIDDVGVIARVTPQDKVRLVDLLQRKGQVVAMTGDGVNDAPALKRADIGIAMGITGTEVTKEAAVMILTDDNFSTIVKAVELGRGLYDNLTRYIRFQMGCLFGFIVTFLGSSILNILGGVPFLPLQTLWINFTTLLFQAIGLGYGQPSDGLMERSPRPPDRADPDPRAADLAHHRRRDHRCRHPRRDQLGRTRLRRGGRPHDGHGHVLAVHPVLLHRHEGRARTAFTLDTLSDKTFARATGISVLTLIGATVLGPLQAFLDTTALTFQQWLICTGLGVTILVVSEIQKAIRRRISPAPGHLG